MELKIVLAERLNNLLKKNGWSTYKLSRKTGLTPTLYKVFWLVGTTI